MCGRYALAMRPSDVQRILEQNDMPVSESPTDHDNGGSVRQTYNFAPGYFGLVYRAESQSHGGTEQVDCEKHDSKSKESSYKIQSMKWGLVPSWSKRNPDYNTMLKTINCRDDSLSTPGGMWQSMKTRKRCIVIAQGFFEWLQVGPKEKLPHYIKRKDGQLMCFAGLWDCVQHEEQTTVTEQPGVRNQSTTYTYTIITTDSNKQLKFLHTRMPVILEAGSKELWTWLDPERREWSSELQSLLRPFKGELDVYPVNKDVGKVGNNSPSFIIPIDSKENKSNIANFFKNTTQKFAIDSGSSKRKRADDEDDLAKSGGSPLLPPQTAKRISATKNTVTGRSKQKKGAVDGNIPSIVNFFERATK